MAALSDYAEQQIIDHLFRTGTFAKPAAIYIALFTAAPSDSGGGTEASGGSYARVEVPQADAQWNAPGTTGLTDNVNVITFPTATAPWGTITHFGIFDAAAAGNLLLHGAVTTSKVIGTGDIAQFAAGTLDVTFA